MKSLVKSMAGAVTAIMLVFGAMGTSPCLAEGPFVTGAVLDTNGVAISGALVRLQSLANEDEFTATTNWAGIYTVNLGSSTNAEEFVADGFMLHQNYPNPFNPSTIISFDLARAGHARLDVFNVLGQRVSTLADEVFPAGQHRVTWDGTDQSGAHVGAGIYFARLQSDQGSMVRKMLLLDGGRPSVAAHPVAKTVGMPAPPVPPDSLYRITVTKDGYMIDGCEPVAITPGGGTITQDFTLKPLDMTVALAYVYGSQYGWWTILDPLDGAAPVQFPAANAPRGMTFSPDGTYFLYYPGYSDELTSLNLDTDESVVLTDAYNPGYSTPAWSPDGSLIYFYEYLSGSTFKRYSMNPDGTDIQESPASTEPAKWYFTDNFTYCYLDGAELYQSNRDNAEPELILDLASLTDLSTAYLTGNKTFNPFTHDLVINAAHDGVYHLYAINVFTGDARLIDDSAGRGPIISPEKHILVYVNDGWDIVILDADDYSVVREVPIDQSIWEVVTRLQFSPHGGYLSFIRSYAYTYEHLYVMDTETGHIICINEELVSMSCWNPRFPY